MTTRRFGRPGAAGIALIVPFAISISLAGGSRMAQVNESMAELDSLETSAATVGCAILDENGATVTTIAASAFGDSAYWLSYASGGVSAKTVKFTLTPNFSGSPVTKQTQVFHPNSATPIITPFGVPFWGGNLTSGEWKLVVRNDKGQTATCIFTVTP